MPLLGTFEIMGRGWRLFTSSLEEVTKAIWKPYVVALLLSLLLGIPGLMLMTENRLLGIFLILLDLAISLPFNIYALIRMIQTLWRRHSGETLNNGVWQLALPLIGVSLLVTVSIIFGAILFIIPAIIFMIWFQFSINALVIDKRHGMQALRYSKSLVRGRFWQVFGRTILLGIILGFITWLTSLPSAIFQAVYQTTFTPDLFSASYSIMIGISTVWSGIIGYFLSLFGQSANIIFYKNLKDEAAIPSSTDPSVHTTN